MASEPMKVHVPLGERAYDIVIGDDLLDRAGDRLEAQFPGPAGASASSPIRKWRANSCRGWRGRWMQRGWDIAR